MPSWGLEAALGLASVGVLIGLGVIAWRTLQLCPHCGWIVRRVKVRWLRCPRCHRQYGREIKRR